MYEIIFTDDPGLDDSNFQKELTTFSESLRAEATF